MFRFSSNLAYSIGVDISDDALKLVQLGSNGVGISLLAGGSESRPADVKPGSSDWQRWVIEALCKLTSNGRFRGRAVVATIPASEVFIDHIKMPKIKEGLSGAKKSIWAPGDKDTELSDAVLSRIKQKLPFDPEDVMIKYIPTEQDNALVMAAERKKIDRHLAIYEEANLQIRSMAVWPMALANSYVRFFGRRKADIEAVVMLVDIEPRCTNVVICRHSKPLFARSISVGASQLGAGQDDEMMTRLVLELTGCRRQFGSMYKNSRVERLIFLSGQAVDRSVCTAVAKQLEIPAQMGDCLAAVEVLVDGDGPAVDRRGCEANWATAFGLSLS